MRNLEKLFVNKTNIFVNSLVNNMANISWEQQYKKEEIIDKKETNLYA